MSFGDCAESISKLKIDVVLVPVRAAYAARRKLRNGSFLAGCDIQQMQLADAVLVGDEGDCLAILAEVEGLHVPLDRRTKVRMLFGREINVSEPLEFGLLVRGNENPLAVLAELGAA